MIKKIKSYINEMNLKEYIIFNSEVIIGKFDDNSSIILNKKTLTYFDKCMLPRRHLLSDFEKLSYSNKINNLIFLNNWFNKDKNNIYLSKNISQNFENIYIFNLNKNYFKKFDNLIILTSIDNKIKLKIDLINHLVYIKRIFNLKNDFYIKKYFTINKLPIEYKLIVSYCLYIFEINIFKNIFIDEYKCIDYFQTNKTKKKYFEFELNEYIKIIFNNNEVFLHIKFKDGMNNFNRNNDKLFWSDDKLPPFESLWNFKSKIKFYISEKIIIFFKDNIILNSNIFIDNSFVLNDNNTKFLIHFKKNYSNNNESIIFKKQINYLNWPLVNRYKFENKEIEYNIYEIYKVYIDILEINNIFLKNHKKSEKKLLNTNEELKLELVNFEENKFGKYFAYNNQLVKGIFTDRTILWLDIINNEGNIITSNGESFKIILNSFIDQEYKKYIEILNLFWKDSFLV